MATFKYLVLKRSPGIQMSFDIEESSDWISLNADQFIKTLLRLEGESTNRTLNDKHNTQTTLRLVKEMHLVVNMSILLNDLPDNMSRLIIKNSLAEVYVANDIHCIGRQHRLAGSFIESAAVVLLVMRDVFAMRGCK
ncbi:MAG: hypothetical protein VX915_05610 [Pseudomonadota bacterium]|nr:hypothetical protein [Pseudomonadota bacterium]